MFPVISSEARNLGQKTKISQSQSLTSFETRSFEMTKVGLWRLSGGAESGHTLDYAALIPTEISRIRIFNGATSLVEEPAHFREGLITTCYGSLLLQFSHDLKDSSDFWALLHAKQAHEVASCDQDRRRSFDALQ